MQAPTKLIGTVLVAGCCGATLASSSGCSSKGNNCEEVENVELGDDEPAPTGQTPADVFALAAGSRMAAMTWKAGVTNADASEPTQVSVSVERNAETATFVRTEQVGNRKSDLGCGARIVVPVRLAVATDDGALDEQFDAELVYNADDGPVTEDSGATIFVQFDFSELHGWLLPGDELMGATGELNATFGSDEHGFLGLALDEGSSERYDTAGYWGHPPNG